MCQDHPAAPPSRRDALRLFGGAGLAAAAVAGVPGLRAGNRVRHAQGLPRGPRGGVSFGGQTAYSMSMHTHTSFSEYVASMQAQLYQATVNGVDVLWFTDHDHRMDGKFYWLVDNFTSLNGPKTGGQRKTGAWQPREAGPSGAGSGGGIVSSPCSPNDPVAGGALRVSAQSTSSSVATYGFVADSEQYRDNLNGQSVSIDVLLDPGWTRGHLEIRISSSYHEASGGRPAGTYTLSYRLVPSGTTHSTTQGNTGIVVIPTVADGKTWTTVTVTPSQDIATLWPDLDHRDFSFYMLGLYAGSSSKTTVTGYFDYLRFNRTLNGGELFAQQANMIQAFAPQFPAVTQQQGLEMSLGLPHINWYGPSITVPTYDGIGYGQTYKTWITQQGIPGVHKAGGLCSYNHPYGTSWTNVVKPKAEQNKLLAQVAAELLPARLYGADILEVGYPKRAGVDLAHHLALWDILSRNAVFVTGNGTSDDHWGQDWAGLTWNWTTSAWAASTGMPDLLAALAAGQVYMGSLAGFAPSQGACLNLSLDSECPMGSVSLSARTSRVLRVTAKGIPAGGRVQVLQGPVDYAGAVVPGMNVVAAFSDVEMAAAGGQVRVALDTSAESFARTVVLDARGLVQGASNPLWALQNTPPNGIPAPRQT